jgi:uncharacterized protein YkwD
MIALILLALSVDVAALEADVLDLVNRYRFKLGLETLQPHEEIAAVARERSQQVADGHSFDHVGFRVRAEKVANHVKYWGISENLYRATGGSEFAERALRTWLESPSHKKNLDGNYQLTGIGWRSTTKGE